MKILVLLTLTPFVTLFAAPVDIPSEISAVTVYADRARVTRTGAASLPAGETILRFADLPVGLDDSSVQAGGTGSGVKILGLEIRQQFSEQVVNDRVRELEAQLQALNDTQADLNAHSADLREQEKFLTKIREGLTLASDDTAKTPPQGVEKIKPLYDFYRAELAAVSKDTLANQIAIRDLQPKKQVVSDELTRLRGNGSKTQKEVLVAVKAAGAGDVHVSLSYNMSGASWSPLYDARIDTTAKSDGVELTCSGVVRQQTGEDWKNVKLSLSTARPSVGARMPELQPWWLQILQPVPVSSSMARDGYALLKQDKLAQNSMLRDQSGVMDEEAKALQPQAPAPAFENESAEINSAGISAIFDIKLPANIPSDGETHQVTISTRKFDGQLSYIATPKLAELAYLKTHLTNTSDAPLLGGQVNLFRDGDFVGQSRINFIAPGAEFDFFLGVDDGVKVTRKTLIDKSAEGGILQKRKSLQRKYEITIENYKTQPVKVTVLDQLPVAQDASITISKVNFSDAPTTQDKDTGKLTWDLTLDPKQKKTLTEDFTADWPADKQVQGL